MLSGVGKAYRNWGSEWKRVASWFGFPTRPLEEHWVLQDINLHVGPGETIGSERNGISSHHILPDCDKMETQVFTPSAEKTEGFRR